MTALFTDGSNIDVNARSPVDDSSALHMAAVAGDHKVTKVLLEKGAKQDLQDKQDNTPLHLATQAGHDKVVKALMATCDSVSCFCGGKLMNF